jgi:ribonuclease E
LPRRRSRRGRRGGRRRSGQDGAAQGEVTPVEADLPLLADDGELAGEEPPTAPEATAVEATVDQPVDQEEAPAPARPRRRPRATAATEGDAAPRRSRRKTADVVEPAEAAAAPATETTPEADEPAAKPRRSRRKPAAAEVDGAGEPNGADHSSSIAAESAGIDTAMDGDAEEDDGEGPRRGWWQRTFGP